MSKNNLPNFLYEIKADSTQIIYEKKNGAFKILAVFFHFKRFLVLIISVQTNFHLIRIFFNEFYEKYFQKKRKNPLTLSSFVDT